MDEKPSETIPAKRETIQSMLGIAHEYANPALTEQEEGFAGTSLDFVDCLLAAYHLLNGESVFTFDKKLNKHLNAV